MAVPAVAVEIGRERRRLRKQSQAKGQRAQQDEPQHGPVVSRVFEGVQGDEIQNAAAQRQGHEFGDVNGKIPEAGHRGKDGFERHDGDERDQDLRFEATAAATRSTFVQLCGFEIFAD